MLTCELTALPAHPSCTEAPPQSPALDQPVSLEQRLREEGHRVIKQPGPIGTREWLLVFKPAPMAASNAT